jgi:hypothetical protein
MVRLFAALFFMGLFAFTGWYGIGILVIIATIYNFSYRSRHGKFPGDD